MESKNVPTMEQIEQRLLGWEKWLYAYYSAALVMLAQAFIKANENMSLTDALFFVEEKAGIASSQHWHIPLPHREYYFNISDARMSEGRIALWLIIQILPFVCAAILAFHPTWRKSALPKRLDLIFGYLLAAWVTMLTLGAQEPLSASDGYNIFIIVYLLAIVFGYWWLRRKKDKAEEVFP